MSTKWLWDAFVALSGTRDSGFGPSPIKYSQLLAYCQLNEINGAERDLLSRCVRELDQVWLEWARKKSE